MMVRTVVSRFIHVSSRMCFTQLRISRRGAISNPLLIPSGNCYPQGKVGVLIVQRCRARGLTVSPAFFLYPSGKYATFVEGSRPLKSILARSFAGISSYSARGTTFTSIMNVRPCSSMPAKSNR